MKYRSFNISITTTSMDFITKQIMEIHENHNLAQAKLHSAKSVSKVSRKTTSRSKIVNKCFMSLIRKGNDQGIDNDQGKNDIFSWLEN
jgi:hypothetical protein